MPTRTAPPGQADVFEEVVKNLFLERKIREQCNEEFYDQALSGGGLHKADLRV